jgi:hypothetical protein
MPDGNVYAVLVFTDDLGTRTHVLDGAAAALHGAELARLARFIAVGLEPPPAEGAGPLTP